MRPAGLHHVRGLFGTCHVLVDERRRAVIIDSGLIGYAKAFRRLFSSLALAPASVDAILLTHGHLDHTGNAAWLHAWSGAPVLAHPLEHAHIDGVYPYRGLTRICGALEALGRAATRYRPVAIDRPLADGDVLPFWGGLRVVHLPGHTLGHCGFWSERHRLLFCGDLVAMYGRWTVKPPRFLNVAPELIPASLRKAAALQPRLVAPNHFRGVDSLETMAAHLIAQAR
ncbi:MAG: MBL fold metallo-hydrolase [Opitutaceae bacterium]|nr:MBL fold metallo-hydrolase [Opitutaceae bacterium]